MASPARKQRLIMDFIRQFIGSHGYSPSIREIQAGVVISSPSVVAYHLGLLEAKGRIARTPGIARSIRVL
jgi:repressor LexA